MERIRAAVAGVVARYARRCWWADREDLTQEGLRAALEARRTWDPAVGVPEEGYCARAASRALSSYLFRTGAPVSSSDGDVRELAGLHHAPLMDDSGHLMPSPEEELDFRRWLRAVREELEPILGDDALLPGRMVVYDGECSREVAARLDLNVHEVYASAVRFRAAVWGSERLWRLWQAMRFENAVGRARE